MSEAFVIIFTFLSGAASVAGYIRAICGKTRYRWMEWAAFAVAIIWCGYVLGVPGNAIRNNVESKTRSYTSDIRDGILVQEGVLSFSGNGPLDVVFEKPYAKRPHVVILNSRGYDDSHTPSVRYEGKHSFSVVRYGSTGLSSYWDSFKSYRWIAEGVPMQEE